MAPHLQRSSDNENQAHSVEWAESLVWAQAMVIQHYRHIITHLKYVHNALLMDALSYVLPKVVVEVVIYLLVLLRLFSALHPNYCLKAKAKDELTFDKDLLELT